MKNFPILFSLRDVVVGTGFVAGVAINGRALLRDEEEGCWVDGVFPGAVTAGGKNRDEALLRFRESYRAVLYDLAASFNSFDAFNVEVNRFFWEQTPSDSDDWNRAVEELRADPAAAGDWLPVRKGYGEPSVKVTCLQQEELDPAQNPTEEMELASAAA